MARCERFIPCAPTRVFPVIADVHSGQRMLLTEHFRDYQVHRSKNGSTLLSWVLHVGTHRRQYRMAIERVVPGKLLVERDTLSSFTLIWDVTAEEEGCRVVLESQWDQRSRGVPALFERIFAPRSLQRIYEAMLYRLEGVASSDQVVLGPAVDVPETEGQQVGPH
ncbi:MAG: SRPBCC family protein [Chloroflexi bacterium]|nr:SRPBCC family protein [Chloroflexota bacterium]